MCRNIRIKFLGGGGGGVREGAERQSVCEREGGGRQREIG